MSLIKKAITLILRNQLSKLDKMYQRHAGEECYIFGNGISLKWMDLDCFSDKVSILGNMMVYHKDVEVLNAPYSTIIEPYFFLPYYTCGPDGKPKLTRHYLYREYRKEILKRPGMSFFINFSNYPVVSYPNAIFVSRFYNPPFTAKNPFSERQDAYKGTLNFQLSLAIFMGFKKAYLVGVDYTHLPSRSLHFYEKGEGVLDNKSKFNMEFINYAKQYLELCTITLDGTSETMQAITYRDLTGRMPRFRENTDIVDMDKLKNLSTWSAYSIF